jgi:hypothetical protein
VTALHRGPILPANRAGLAHLLELHENSKTGAADPTARFPESERVISQNSLHGLAPEAEDLLFV